jgi:hypothetical protein
LNLLTNSNNFAYPASLTRPKLATRQAIQTKMPYTDFLAGLVGDEIARRENTRFGMRVRRAQFRATKTSATESNTHP